MLAALEELHAHDLVRDDFRPRNAVFKAQGVRKLVDFGLVADLRGFGSETAANDKSGTAGYIAPEITLRELTHARTSYERAAGVSPFKREEYARP